MPFVDEEHRRAQDFEIPGDRCYWEYKLIMDKWRNSPRWTTVDAIAERLWPDDWKRAFALAFLVFFVLHVMKYERIKRIENGDI